MHEYTIRKLAVQRVLAVRPRMLNPVNVLEHSIFNSCNLVYMYIQIRSVELKVKLHGYLLVQSTTVTDFHCILYIISDLNNSMQNISN